MAITTTYDVYSMLLGLIRTAVGGLSPPIGSEYCYISPIAHYNPMNDSVIQLIPGVPQTRHPVSGTGSIDEEFTVALWRRVHLDSGIHSTERITNDTLGAGVILEAIRGGLIQQDQNDSNLIEIPIRFIRGSVPSEPPNDQQSGWLLWQDTYEIGYEIAWP